MPCDRCGRNIDDGPLVTMGAKRPYRALCRTCWGVETRSSNTRLITALNEMTRKLESQGSAGAWDGQTERRRAGRTVPGAAGERRRGKSSRAGTVDVEDRRHDPDRPQWHL